MKTRSLLDVLLAHARAITSLFVFLAMVGLSIGADSDTKPAWREQEAKRRKQTAAMLREEFGHAESLELVAIDADNRNRTKRTKENTFQGWLVAGRSTTADKNEITAIVGALADDIEAPSDSYGLPSCFNPHHALVLRKENQTKLILVCFRCRNGVIRSASGDLADPPPEDSQGTGFLLIGNSAQLKIKEVFAKHKLINF